MGKIDEKKLVRRLSQYFRQERMAAWSRVGGIRATEKWTYSE